MVGEQHLYTEAFDTFNCRLRVYRPHPDPKTRSVGTPNQSLIGDRNVGVYEFRPKPPGRRESLFHILRDRQYGNAGTGKQTAQLAKGRVVEGGKYDFIGQPFFDNGGHRLPLTPAGVRS